MLTFLNKFTDLGLNDFEIRSKLLESCRYFVGRGASQIVEEVARFFFNVHDWFTDVLPGGSLREHFDDAHEFILNRHSTFSTDDTRKVVLVIERILNRHDVFHPSVICPCYNLEREGACVLPLLCLGRQSLTASDGHNHILPIPSCCESLKERNQQ